MLRLLPVILLVAVVVYALIDCVRTPDDQMPVGIPKVVWVILIILFPGVAALAWIVVSRVAQSEAAATAGARPGLWSNPQPPRPARRTGPLAPDDDPDFLARLESERRKAERERRRLDRETNELGQPGPAGALEAGGATGNGPDLPAIEGNGLPHPPPPQDEDGPATTGGTASQS